MNSRTTTQPQGKSLRLELTEASTVHWSTDHWQTIQDTDTQDCGLGLHVATLPTAQLLVGTQVVFALRQQAGGIWAGEDFTVAVI